MGRRRRRVVRIVKKKLPTVFVCPRCGEEAVKVTIAKDTGKATVLCAMCNLKDEFPAHVAAQPIDVYSYFTDRFYGVKDPRPIIPREREISRIPSEEEPAEELAPPEPPTNEIAQSPESAPGSEETKKELQPASETIVPEPVQPETAIKAPPAEESSVAPPTPPEGETEKEAEEESEPFADILENKDKKRYSPNPLPQQSSEQTS